MYYLSINFRNQLTVTTCVSVWAHYSIPLFNTFHRIIQVKLLLIIFNFHSLLVLVLFLSPLFYSPFYLSPIIPFFLLSFLHLTQHLDSVAHIYLNTRSSFLSLPMLESNTFNRISSYIALPWLRKYSLKVENSRLHCMVDMISRFLYIIIHEIDEEYMKLSFIY